MIKRFVLSLVLIISFISTNSVFAKAIQEDIKISNKNFSITLPYDAKILYYVKKKNNGIYIYDKASKKAGFGGFAFGVQMYKNPSEHAMMPGGRKLGELKDKKGILYDVVLVQPTDVQYDYVHENKDDYMKLYKLGDTIEDKITGKNGAKYFHNQGMKGEDLYKEILNKHVQAVKEKWNSTKLENENISYMYNVLASTNKNVLDKVGYVYYDTNGDGIEELIIGEIAQGSWKGVIYDIYTMVDRQPMHVVSGGTRNRYYVCNDVFLCNEYSSGALESGLDVYILVENSIELFPQVSFKYDGYEDKNSPWFISYSSDKKWQKVSEKVFKERKSTFEKYKRFNYTPLSRFIYR